MASQTLALVGATGGAGTTRTAVELGGVLSLAGEDVAIVDADFGTQGLRRYVEGSVQPDLTAVLTEEAALEAALVPLPVDGPGDVRLCPADAPFERLARAQTAGAAQRFEKHLAAAALSHDVVIVDAPPVDANHAVAAVTSADRVAIVAPDAERGRDGIALVRGRLADVDAEAPTILQRPDTGPGSLGDADARLPEFDAVPVRERPSGTADPETVTQLQQAADTALGRPVDVDPPESGDGLGRFVPGT